jgi:hypothetical protein
VTYEEEGHMPGDPNECREHADYCRRLAKSATSASGRHTFLDLVDTWERLARELENAQAFLRAMKEIEPRKPLAERRRAS